MPAVSAASIAACASATERVKGFSTNTAFPAAAARLICSACKAVRGGEHDRVDRRVAQDRVQIIDPAEVVLAAEISDGGRGAGMRGGEADCLAVPHGRRPDCGPTSRGPRWLRELVNSCVPVGVARKAFNTEDV